MKLFSWVITKGLTFMLVTLPPIALSGCVFGSDNTNQLLKRNNAILGILNDTLFNFTTEAAKTIDTFPSTSLWSYIQIYQKATPANYLEFVSMGKLLALDWKTMTASNSTANQTVASYIYKEYVIPVHNKLQDIAVYYSFAYGIFRPKEIQFNYTGYTADSTSMDKFTLDLSCMAASQFVWRLSTNLFYSVANDDTRTTQFASVASMVEKAFEEYYRRDTSKLNQAFVRANLLSVNGSGDRSVMFLEIYFRNSSLQASDIKNATKIAQLPVLTFKNETNAPKVVLISDDATYTYVINSTLQINISTTITASSTATSTLSTQLTNPGTPGTKSTFPNGNSLLGSSTIVLRSSSLSVNTATSPTILNTLNNALTTLSSSVMASSTSSPNQGLPSSASTTVVTTNTSPLIQTAAPTNLSSLSRTLLSNFQSNLVATSLNASNVSATTAALPSLVNTTQTDQLLYTVANLTTVTQNSSLHYNNTSSLDPAHRQTGSTESTGGVGTKTTNVATSITRGNTFDPDPFFKAEVPVITKVYNDEYLLRKKIGTMAPLTEKAYFFSITIPATIGVIAVAVLCMLCWQTDCSSGRHKA